MTKTVTINGEVYTLGTIKTGVGRKIHADNKSPDDINLALIVASLNAGGHPEVTPQWVDETVDYYGAGGYGDLLDKMLTVNGLKVEASKAPGGEAPAEAAA